MTKPLTLNQFKFDLRVYVVVTGVNPLQAFICDEGLARFCTEKYQAPKKENFKKTFMHLTNYSQNRNSENFVHAKDMIAADILKDNNGTKRTLSSLYDTLAKNEIDVEQIKASISQTCSRILQSFGPMLEHNISAMNGNKVINGNPVQILGIDILID